MKTFKTFLFLVMALALAIGFGWLSSGCSTSATTAAFKTEAAANVSISAAMSAWGVYVAQKHPGAQAEQTVYQAFESWKAADLAAIAATESLATAPTNTPAVQQAATAATAALTTAASGLVAAIQSFGVTIPTNAPAK